MTLTYKGNTIISHHSLVEAKKIVSGLKKTPFINDLLNARAPTHGQIFWLHKIAVESQTPVENKPGKYTKLIELFVGAKKSLVRPAITFQLGADNIKISYAKDSSNNPNHLYVKHNDEYVGKITPFGEFKPFKCPALVHKHLDELNDNPVAKAKEYGHASGNCCFCHHELTDERSLKVGWGPVCAVKWGLPWGE